MLPKLDWLEEVVVPTPPDGKYTLISLILF
jgi:hypothetical protein